MSEINYINIIDELSPRGLTKFIVTVYDQLHYSVLSVTELRKVDVKEKLPGGSFHFYISVKIIR